ncbi:MAG: PA2779 family protein [Desulfobacteraceae bacterium]|jgi:hypothetical protein|nr:PA2779 family protein [Desulfobacteraceae bacterium]
MKIIRKKIGFISLFMATIMLLIATPCQPLLAAMVPTEATIYKINAQDARDHLKTLISRNDIKNALISQGIDPMEAKARVDSLSDSEVIEVADKIEQLPAGGGAFGAVIAASVIVFLVLLITDILGYTDVFPFVKSQQK